MPGRIKHDCNSYIVLGIKYAFAMMQRTLYISLYQYIFTILHEVGMITPQIRNFRLGEIK